MSPRSPLHRFRLCRSSDPHEFNSELNRIYYPGVLAPDAVGPFPRPSMLAAVHDPDFTLVFIRPGGGARITPDRDTTTYHVNVALAGSLVAVAGGAEVLVEPGTAAVHGPRERHELHTRPGSGVIGLKLSRALVEGELGAMLGRPVTGPIRWEAGFDLRSGPGRSWRALLEFTLAELEQPGLMDSPHVRRRQIRALVAGLLTAQPHTYTAALTAPERTLRPRPVHRAVEHVHAHFAEPLTVTDLAAAAGSSVRRLQEAFDAHLGISPMAYLRQVRLDEARRLLAAGGTGVTDAAIACGFGHLGRFAAAYRERFGELPSATIS
jgi:AraC-like DNA-binding protein